MDEKSDERLRKYPEKFRSPPMVQDISQTSVTNTYHSLKRTYQEVMFCGNGNKALFGQCIASAGTSLELRIELNGPVHPGLIFTVSVRKLDHYNQTVASDSSSIVQIRSEAGINSSDEDVGFGLAAAISGATIFELQGGSATTNVDVRPFIIRAADSSTQRASEAIIYAEGMDSETFLGLRFVM